MSLILRRQKGEALTVEELDGNLTHIESLGVNNVTKQGNSLVFQRPNNDTVSIDIDNNAPVVTKKKIATIENKGDVNIYRGVMKYDSQNGTTSIPLIYYPTQNNFTNISLVPERYYYFSGILVNCFDGICDAVSFKCTLDSALTSSTSVSNYNITGDTGVISLSIPTITNSGLIQFELLETIINE